MSVNKFDTETITYINHLMKDINDKSDDIYESLMDRDIKGAAKDINSLKAILDDILSQLSSDV